MTLVDTGLHTMTGGRLKRLREHVGDAPFCMTYGDGVARLDIQKVIAFHQSHGRLATVTAVRPPSRFGTLDLGTDDRVAVFREKPVGGDHWINGGFFVLSRDVERYLVFRRLATDPPAFGEPLLSVAAGRSSYEYVDAQVLPNTDYVYGLAAQDCNPLNSPVAQAAVRTRP